MELQRSFKTSIRNTYGILGSGGDTFSREGRFSSFLSADRLKTLVYTILPDCGGFLAQPTYRELRDRGTDSLRGFRACGQWSPCPSSRSSNLCCSIN
jgi:hypothetical protein